MSTKNRQTRQTQRENVEKQTKQKVEGIMDMVNEKLAAVVDPNFEIPENVNVDDLRFAHRLNITVQASGFAEKSWIKTVQKRIVTGVKHKNKAIRFVWLLAGLLFMAVMYVAALIKQGIEWTIDKVHSWLSEAGTNVQVTPEEAAKMIS